MQYPKPHSFMSSCDIYFTVFYIGLVNVIQDYILSWMMIMMLQFCSVLLSVFTVTDGVKGGHIRSSHGSPLASREIHHETQSPQLSHTYYASHLGQKPMEITSNTLLACPDGCQMCHRHGFHWQLNQSQQSIWEILLFFWPRSVVNVHQMYLCNQSQCTCTMSEQWVSCLYKSKTAVDNRSY